MTVVVRDGRIASIERSGAALPDGVREVDGAGRFLIPGLWDMHVHLSSTTVSALPVLVANGVTGVRDLGGDLAELDDWRMQIAAGTLVGPRIVRAGPMLNGRRLNRYMVVVNSPDQARRIVRGVKLAGADLVKVHRLVPRDAYFAIVDEAKQQGLDVVGHVPMTVRPEEASDAGQLIEHVETLFEGVLAEGLRTAQLPNRIREFRAKEGDALFARFVKNHTPVTPTLGAWQYLIEHPDRTFLSDPLMKYVARSVKSAAASGPPPVAERDLFDVAQVAAEYREVVAQMNRAGVTLIAGTDIEGARIPGFSLHAELLALVDAELTPLQALAAATINAARVLHKESDFGSVSVGKVADLVLLEANPLDDIRNTQRIAAVVTGGTLLDRAALDSLLLAAEKLAEQN